jgi:hypothetical protein
MSQNCQCTQSEEIAHQVAARSDGRKFGEFFDERHTVRRFEVRQVDS